MGIKINVADGLMRIAELPETVEVTGSTIRECLNDLVRKYPDAKKWLFDKRGRPLMLVVLNKGSSYVTDLKRPIKVGDELNLIMIVGGG